MKCIDALTVLFNKLQMGMLTTDFSILKLKLNFQLKKKIMKEIRMNSRHEDLKSNFTITDFALN